MSAAEKLRLLIFQLLMMFYLGALLKFEQCLTRQTVAVHTAQFVFLFKATSSLKRGLNRICAEAAAAFGLCVDV